MLKLVDIKKDYGDKDYVVPALKGINLEFRESEFVSILGPSGCGKTTLLNIIGGLDKYSSGDLIINGRSTKDYADKDWDAYRNRTIGFVFQDYNLIPHLTVVENVELALTLSGVSYKERKPRALAALERVGLAEHAKKRPNQLSGGQKQRVAIARAIVNNPDIILADEPTGALDSKTSTQIMDILKEISADRLVIMVTHNNELADIYSTRVISLLDGVVVSDTKPYDSSTERSNILEAETASLDANKDTNLQEPENQQTENDDNQKKDKLEKAKTSMSFITALSLSLKNLFTKKTRTILTALGSSIGIIGIALILSVSNGFNIYIANMQRDSLSTMPITIGQSVLSLDFEQISNSIESGNPEMTDDKIASYVPGPSALYHFNNITQDYMTYLANTDPTTYTFMTYRYNMTFNIAKHDGDEFSYLEGVNLFQLADNTDYLNNQYPLVAGHYPTQNNEILLILNSNGTISENLLSQLGIAKGNGEAYEYEPEDLLNNTYKVILNNEAYAEVTPTHYEKLDLTESIYNNENAIELTIAGIVKNDSMSSQFDMSSMLGGSNDYEGIGYLNTLADYIHEQNYNSNIAVAQRANPTIDITTGDPFRANIYQTVEDLYLDALQNLGGYELPTSISIYTDTFEAKAELLAYLDAYNIGLDEDDQILYTDTSEIISETFSTIVDAISIVLIVFAAISLAVSSIMIGIITYVSVIERTKEIGVLRSLGARKRDIARVFNSETFLIGLTSGILGIIISLILLIPINLIISSLAAGVEVSAIMNPLHALILIALSTVLTLIAGLIPASIASKKEPVKCLRAE